MNPQIAFVFSTFITILIFCVIGNSLLSWFPSARQHPVGRVLSQITEPLLQPVRNLLPRTGGIDFSGMIVVFILFMMLRVIEGVTQQ